MTARPVILCVNSGSSSLKFALYQFAADAETALADGAVERIGLPDGRLWIHAERQPRRRTSPTMFPTIKRRCGSLCGPGAVQLPAPDAVGHRIVHGGADHTAPERVDARLLEDLRRLVPYAPLHLPAEIQGIEAVAARFPRLPQVACFDTAFHRRMPELAQRFPLPRALWDEGAALRLSRAVL